MIGKTQERAQRRAKLSMQFKIKRVLVRFYCYIVYWDSSSLLATKNSEEEILHFKESSINSCLSPFSHENIDRPSNGTDPIHRMWFSCQNWAERTEGI